MKTKERMEKIEDFVRTIIIGFLATGVFCLFFDETTHGGVLIIVGMVMLAIGSLTVFVPRVYSEDYKYLNTEVKQGSKNKKSTLDNKVCAWCGSYKKPKWKTCHQCGAPNV